MSFNALEFVQLDPNWPQSSTAKVLRRKFGVQGLVMFPTVLALAGRMVGTSSKFSFHISDLTEATGIEEQGVVQMLNEWAESSKRRQDGFRFGWVSEQDGSAWIDWPEFVDRHRNVISKRRNGAKGGRQKSSANADGDEPPGGQDEVLAPTGSGGEADVPNIRQGTDEEPTRNRRPPHSRVEDRREEKRIPPLTPPEGGRVVDPDAPHPALSGTAVLEASYCIADLERITGTLDQKERTRAVKKMALVISDIQKAGKGDPGRLLRQALAAWPENEPTGLGIVLQKLHGHAMGHSGVMTAKKAKAEPTHKRLEVPPDPTAEDLARRQKAGEEFAAAITGKKG